MLWTMNKWKLKSDSCDNLFLIRNKLTSLSNPNIKLSLLIIYSCLMFSLPINLSMLFSIFLFSKWSSSNGWGLEYIDCIHCRGVRPHPKKVYPGCTKLHLIVRLQFWKFVWIHCYYSRVHSDLEGPIYGSSRIFFFIICIWWERETWSLILPKMKQNQNSLLAKCLYSSNLVSPFSFALNVLYFTVLVIAFIIANFLWE